jgi:hypothetical protein
VKVDFRRVGKLMYNVIVDRVGSDRNAEYIQLEGKNSVYEEDRPIG